MTRYGLNGIGLRLGLSVLQLNFLWQGNKFSSRRGIPLGPLIVGNAEVFHSRLHFDDKRDR
jgi:hypothetical protein